MKLIKSFKTIKNTLTSLASSKMNLAWGGTTSLTLLNNFTGTASCKKHDVGIAKLTGNVTVGATTAAHTIICTLPEGFFNPGLITYLTGHNVNTNGGLSFYCDTTGNIKNMNTLTTGHVINVNALLSLA